MAARCIFFFEHFQVIFLLQLFKEARAYRYITDYAPVPFALARGFGTVVKHSTADPGIASSISPLTPTKIVKGDMYWFFPGKMLPCISVLHWAR